MSFCGVFLGDVRRSCTFVGDPYIVASIFALLAAGGELLRIKKCQMSTMIYKQTYHVIGFCCKDLLYWRSDILYFNNFLENSWLSLGMSAFSNSYCSVGKKRTVYFVMHVANKLTTAVPLFPPTSNVLPRPSSSSWYIARTAPSLLPRFLNFFWASKGVKYNFFPGRRKQYAAVASSLETDSAAS